LIQTQALIAGLLAGSTISAGANAVRADPDTYGVHLVNDRIAKTDRYFTNGFRLS